MKAFKGEFIGTFILVFFGCGSVAASVLFNAFNLFQVAIIWGVGVAFGIIASRKWSDAHLNPAVTVAMSISGRFSIKNIPNYIGAQLLGSIVAAATLYALFYPSIINYELTHEIVRGLPESRSTAMIFGEFFPNPGFKDLASIGIYGASFAEMLGTFLLVITIFYLVDNIDNKGVALPFLIGLTVSLIICIIAPITQAGLNPARDFGPRIFAMIAGWNRAAFPDPLHGFFTVYILSPILGGFLASKVYNAWKTTE